MKIGIITAMASEQKQLANQLENKTERKEGPFTYIEGSIKQNTIILMQCGIGKVNAAAGTVELIRTFQPDCIISTGVAGGIDRCLKIMDVVVSQQIVYHDVWCGEGNAYGQIQGLPTFFQGNETLYQCALSLDTETAIHGGLICTGDKFITDRSELDRFFSQLPKSRNADAIIISSFQLMPAMRDQLQAIDLPTVGVNVPAESGYFDASISIDNSSAMTMAVRLLRSLGHTNIAFCSDYIPADMVYNTSQRTQAFADAAQANATDGITFSLLTADAHDAPLSKSDLASQLTAKLLSLPERPTAVCVETDQVAIALVKELRKQQLNVPEDISVLGFDDAEIAQAADLSTIRQEPIELGRIAGRKVLQLLRNEPLEHPHELQDPLLVLRNTTSRIDSGAAPAE